MYVIIDKSTGNVIAKSLDEALTFSSKIEAKCWVMKNYSFEAIKKYKYVLVDKNIKSVFTKFN